MEGEDYSTDSPPHSLQWRDDCCSLAGPGPFRSWGELLSVRRFGSLAEAGSARSWFRTSGHGLSKLIRPADMEYAVL